MKLSQHFETTIEDLAFWWEAIVKIDWFVIFIKWAIPWQKVKAFLTKKKKNHWEAKILEILERSPLEIESKCKHFGKCWGCKWQNLDYNMQLEFKEKQVYECLRGIWKIKSLNSTTESLQDDNIENWKLKIENCKLNNIIPSPKIFWYRNKVELSFWYEKMSVKIDESWNKIFEDTWASLGFHRSWRWQEIVEIKHCELVSDNANKTLNTVKDFCLSKKDKKVYNPYSHKGFWRHLLIRENLKWEIMICLIAQTKEKNWSKSEVWSSTENYSDLIPKLKDLNVKSFFTATNNWLNDDWSDWELELIYWNEVIHEEILWLNFAISPKSFFQTNSLWAEKLYSTVLNFAFENNNDNKIILDLYCGTWTIWQIISKNSSDKNIKIIWIELIKSAVEDANLNAKLNNLSNIEFIYWKVENILPNIINEYKNIDLIILDPPRSWMHKKALETILNISPKQIIYVSCNPTTFARDFSILEEKYDIIKLQPVDMFPHTAHIEIVCKLELKQL